MSFLVGTTPRFFPGKLTILSGNLESSGPASDSLCMMSAVWFFFGLRSDLRMGIKALTELLVVDLSESTNDNLSGEKKLVGLVPIFQIQFFRKIVNNAKIITFRKENTCDCKTNAFLYKSKRCYNSLFLWSFFTFNTILFFLCFPRARSLFDDNMIILDSIGDVSVCEQFLFGNIGSDTNSFFGTGRT